MWTTKLEFFQKSLFLFSHFITNFSPTARNNAIIGTLLKMINKYSPSHHTNAKLNFSEFSFKLISCVRVSEAGNINLYICFALHTLWYAPLMSTSFIKIILEFWIRCKLDTCNERFIFLLMSGAHVWANFEYSNISRLE